MTLVLNVANKWKNNRKAVRIMAENVLELWDREKLLMLTKKSEATKREVQEMIGSKREISLDMINKSITM